MPNDPGIVPLAIASIFRAIEASPGRDFLLRLSMMEIYNEVRVSKTKRVGVPCMSMSSCTVRRNCATCEDAKSEEVLDDFADDLDAAVMLQGCKSAVCG